MFTVIDESEPKGREVKMVKIFTKGILFSLDIFLNRLMTQ